MIGKRTLNDLLALGGAPPPPPAIDINTQPQQLDEVKHLYYSIYAPGLESFLESKWFSSKGLAQLLASRPLLDQFASLLAQFARTTPNDPKEIQYTTSVEARVVWALASMVRTAPNEQVANGEYKQTPGPDDPNEAANRLTVFETLLTGKVATTNVLTAPVPGSADHHRLRELEFWYNLGNFVTLQDGEGDAATRIDDTLSSLRNLLDGRENRDVLYSIAVVRAIGPRVAEYNNEDTPLHLDESDNKSKLLVAKKFVADEASGNGTTNVIRRLCELANRSWSPPTILPAAASTPTPAGYSGSPPAAAASATPSNPATPTTQGVA